MHILLRSLLGLSLAAAPAFATLTIDFELDAFGVPLTSGDTIANQYSAAPYYATFSFKSAALDGLVGVTGVAANGGTNTVLRSSGSVGESVLAIQTEPVPVFANDPDLGTGASSIVTPPNVPQGLIAIVSEGGQLDDNAKGGVISIDFSVPVTLKAADFIDIENNKSGFYAVFNGGANYTFFQAGPTADGEEGSVGFNDLSGVTRLDFYMKSSGGLSTLSYSPIPEPATILGAIALGFIGLTIFQRRKSKK